MTGTGSSVFASCSDREQAMTILSRLQAEQSSVAVSRHRGLVGCQGFVARGINQSRLHAALGLPLQDGAARRP